MIKFKPLYKMQLSFMSSQNSMTTIQMKPISQLGMSKKTQIQFLCIFYQNEQNLYMAFNIE